MKRLLTAVLAAVAILAVSPARALAASYRQSPQCEPTASNTATDGVLTFTVTFQCPTATITMTSVLTPGPGVSCTPADFLDVDVDPDGAGRIELSLFIEQECAGEGTVTSLDTLEFVRDGKTIQQAGSESVFPATALIEIIGGGEVDRDPRVTEAHFGTVNQNGAGGGVSGTL